MDRTPRSADVSWILVAGFALAMLLPIAATPYLGDDIFNSYINGVMGYGHTPFWEWIGNLNASWIRYGRFFPGGLVESYGLFHIVPSLAAYKTFQILITLANVWTFVILLREFRLPRAIGLLGVVVLLCTFQMRVYHDALLGFSGSMEFITELTLLSTLGLLLFARRGNVWALVGSLAAYAIGLVTYEATYLMCLVFFAALLIELPWRRALQLAAPYFAMSAAMICVQLYVKSTAHMQADADYSLSLNLSALLVTFAKQALAGVPFSYVVIDPSNMFAHGVSVFGALPLWVTVAIFALASVATWTVGALIDRAAIDQGGIRPLVAVGLLLWLTPAVLVASSARYQRELVFGLGHAPVYIEYFGVSMLVVAAVSYALVRWGVPPWHARLLASLVFGLAASVTYASNLAVISTSVADKEGLLNMDAALASGLMSEVPSGSDLFVDLTIPAHRYLDGSAADAKYYYFLKTGKRLAVHFAGTLPKMARCTDECRLVRTSYELIDVPVEEYAGYEALGHLRTIETSHRQVRSFASEVALFVRGAPSETPLALQYMEHGCRRKDRLVLRTLPPQPGGTETVRLVSNCGLIEMHSLAISEVVANS